MWSVLIVIGGIVLSLTGFNWLMGYRKNHMQIDFDKRYFDFNEYIRAIKAELESQGKKVDYIGHRRFLIDDKPYAFIERNISMGGVPLQRTILKPISKQSSNQEKV
ncbi:hypothetical protein [Guptibacillus hwajinpoensis]|uniref:Uncharacterized protein n=1 Tax=Guptibacillus hwajinpoensis TaxID=208199 RepID=A0ABU0K7G0_9BACL|nr:hypothetical protein [Alkalihalobacillus hemicentroti]MDQ0484585.1 hypothetical protein [Alkalihalobacillus hemicentroti]